MDDAADGDEVMRCTICQIRPPCANGVCKVCEGRMRRDQHAARAAGLALDVFQAPTPAQPLASTLTPGRVHDLVLSACQNGGSFEVHNISENVLMERIRDPASGTDLVILSCTSVDELREALK